MLPVRLLGRLTADLACSGRLDLERAVRWESAAVVARLTMTEWAFGALLGTAGILGYDYAGLRADG